MAGHPMFSRQIVYRPKWVLRHEIAHLDALSDLRRRERDAAFLDGVH